MRAFLILVFLAFAALASAAPVVFQAPDPVAPGQTALLFGDGLKGIKAEGKRRPDAPETNPEGGFQALDVLQSSELCAKVALPADWKPGEFVIKITATDGATTHVLLNHPQLWWWLGGADATAYAGEELLVFGKNFPDRPDVCLLLPRNIVQSLKVLKAEKYMIRYQVPADIPPGDYQLALGGPRDVNQGEIQSLPIRVARRQPWPQTQYSVRDFGARGDGEADDTPAFQAALAKAAAAGGGVVFVPRGHYKITAKLVIPAKTVLRGEQRERVWLYAPKDLPEFDTVIAGNGDFAVEELSIVAQTARRLVACPDDPAVYTKPWGHEPSAGKLGRNVRLHRLRLLHLRYAHRIQDAKGDPRRQEGVGPSTIMLCGPDMEISDNIVVSSGMPLALHQMRRCRITGNRLDTGRNGWYGIWGAEELLFEGNEIQGRDLEGSYGGTQGRTINVLFTRNHYHDAYGDEREALTFDTPYYATFMGRVGEAGGATLTLRDDTGAAKTWKPGELKGQACFIGYGKGLGQYLQILDNTATELTLERPWAIAPDATSRIAILGLKTRTVIADNTFADASAAVQLYSQAYGFIIDGNRSERTGGMYGIGGGPLWDEKRKTFRYVISCFNQYLNNDLSQGFVYQQGAFMNGIIGPCAGGSNAEPPAVTTIGNVVRNNALRDNFTAGALYFAPHPFTPPASRAGYFGRDTIIEGNAISDTPLALDVYPLMRDTLLRANRIERAALPLRDDGQGTWIHPAERLADQARVLKAFFGDAAAPVAEVERAATELLAKPAAATEVTSECARLRGRLCAAAAARFQTQGASPELLALLTGLRIEFAQYSPVVKALAEGRTGDTEMHIRVHTEPWSPELTVRLWNGDKATLKPGELATLKGKVQLSRPSDRRSMNAIMPVAVAGTTIPVMAQFDIGRWIDEARAKTAGAKAVK